MSAWMRFCGRLRRRVFERLQVRGAAEEIVEHFVFDVGHQLDEHVVSFGLVFDERIFLGVGAQVNAFAQRVHGIEMLLPKPVDRVENDVALEPFAALRLFLAALRSYASLIT